MNNKIKYIPFSKIENSKSSTHSHRLTTFAPANYLEAFENSMWSYNSFEAFALREKLFTHTINIHLQEEYVRVQNMDETSVLKTECLLL